MDLNEYQAAFRAIERIFEIRYRNDYTRSRAIDYEILEICIRAVMDDMKDSKGVGASYLVPKVKSLLEMITSKLSSSQLFTICSRFYSSQNNNKIALDYAQKAYRAALNKPDLNDNLLVFQQLSHVTLGLIEAYEVLGPMMEEVRVGGSYEMVCKDWR